VLHLSFEPFARIWIQGHIVTFYDPTQGLPVRTDASAARLAKNKASRCRIWAGLRPKLYIS
jgi:hypothetical protein